MSQLTHSVPVHYLYYITVRASSRWNSIYCGLTQTVEFRDEVQAAVVSLISSSVQHYLSC